MYECYVITDYISKSTRVYMGMNRYTSSPHFTLSCVPLLAERTLRVWHIVPCCAGYCWLPDCIHSPTTFFPRISPEFHHSTHAFLTRVSMVTILLTVPG